MNMRSRPPHASTIVIELLIAVASLLMAVAGPLAVLEWATARPVTAIVMRGTIGSEQAPASVVYGYGKGTARCAQLYDEHLQASEGDRVTIYVSPWGRCTTTAGRQAAIGSGLLGGAIGAALLSALLYLNLKELHRLPGGSGPA